MALSGIDTFMTVPKRILKKIFSVMMMKITLQ